MNEIDEIDNSRLIGWRKLLFCFVLFCFVLLCFVSLCALMQFFRTARSDGTGTGMNAGD